MRVLSPRVIRVERGRSSRVINSISLPGGSPWCPGGDPSSRTIWHYRSILLDFFLGFALVLHCISGGVGGLK